VQAATSMRFGQLRNLSEAFAVAAS
jgi:hypothetical protein